MYSNYAASLFNQSEVSGVSGYTFHKAKGRKREGREGEIQ